MEYSRINALQKRTDSTVTKKTLVQKYKNQLVIIALLGLVGMIYFSYNNRNVNNTEDQPQAIAKINNILLIKELDEPLIAKVDNIDDAKKENPAFYENAISGDTLMVIKSTRKVVLYRESENKIINFGFLNADSPLLK
jgi:hypothetical protein